jgi:hypothetical protein
MADKPHSNDMKPAMSDSGMPSPIPRTGALAAPTGTPRSADMRDAMSEMAERAQLISQEAGSKITMAMKDVLGTAAGIAGFAIESARDLVQYMVRRGQMTQDDADRLIREAEDAHTKRHPGERSRQSSPNVAADRAPAKAAAGRDGARRDSPTRESAMPKTAKAVKKSPAKSGSAEKKPSTKKAPAKKRR